MQILHLSKYRLRVTINANLAFVKVPPDMSCILARGSSRQHGGLFGDRQVSQQISKQLEILFKNDCGLATLFKT